MYLPIFILRQIGKHQVGMSLSEVSRRYIRSEPQFYVPNIVRKYAEDKKQGSSEELLDSILSDSFDVQNQSCLYQYTRLLDQGVAPEQARMVLPQSMYTTIVWTGSLLSWFHVWNMRTELHAQKETQDYAWLIGEICNNLFPVSWKALTLYASTYTREDRHEGVSWYEDLYEV